MKRVGFVLILLLICGIPAFADGVKPAEDVVLPSIFIWATPDEEVEDQKSENKHKFFGKEDEEDEIILDTEEEPLVLKSTTLKGYTEYIEGAEDILYMDNHKKFVLNIQTPESVASKSIVARDAIVQNRSNMNPVSKFRGEEYGVAPKNKDFVYRSGNWSLGTSFDSETSSMAQIENTTSLFTKYDSKYFSLSSNYKKNNMTGTQIQTDNFSIIPELKFNNVFSLQEVLSADTTRNRRSSELRFTVNPFGKKDIDRFNFGVGAKHTYDVNSGNSWSQLNFSTNFKL